MRPLLCLSLLLLGLCSLRAQTLAIHVSDSISHEALVGASVRTRSGGAATDADGWACLRALPLGPQTLRISYLGYQDNVLNINFLAKNDT
ncbi:MAG TPA: hypothetical protein PK858_07725, partial [Saprospiraceae bacterium]|nr:hypothetical protein [Saprospiraceae bacterium]